MYVKKEVEKDAVSPVIAVILMVAITVVLAGVLFVFVIGLQPPGGTAEIFQLDVTDASTSSDFVATGDNAVFEDDEPILRIEQTGGDPIDWNEYSLKLGIDGQDWVYDCQVYQINGKAYTVGDRSEVGDIILIDCEDASNPFAPDQYVRLSIYDADSEMFTSGLIRIQ